MPEGLPGAAGVGRKLGSSPGFALDLLCGLGLQSPHLHREQERPECSQEPFSSELPAPLFPATPAPLLPAPSSLSAQERGEGTCLDHRASAGVSLEEGAWGRKGLTHLPGRLTQVCREELLCTRHCLRRFTLGVISHKDPVRKAPTIASPDDREGSGGSEQSCSARGRQNLGGRLSRVLLLLPLRDPPLSGWPRLLLSEPPFPGQ